MASQNPTIALPLLLPLLLLFLPQVSSHALMALPQQRGTLRRFRFNENVPEINRSSTPDFRPHFPAGDKCDVPGCGKRSQEREAGPAGWTPFTPLKPSFRWRYGVCGDAKNNQEHIRGGKFYNHAQIVATYPQAGRVSVQINVLAHHNGFMELHVCDVKKCGGEISEACFRKGFCYQLKRSYNPECESGLSRRCAPIDPNYPGRWHFPCSTKKKGNGLQSFGGPYENTILYDLPEGLACDHCVLQWFWSSANSCNPPGVIEFFQGNRAPRTWGKCEGQGGAKGGYARVQRNCGMGDDYRMRFAEEYVTCADISISAIQGRSDGREEDPLPPPPPSTLAPSTSLKPKPSESSQPTATPTPTSTPTAMPTPTRKPTPSPSKMPKPSRTPTPTPTPTPKASKKPAPSKTSTPSPTMTEMAEESPMESAEESMEMSPEWSLEPSPEDTPDLLGWSPEPSLEADMEERDGSLGMGKRRRGVISDVVLLADDGREVRSVRDGDMVDVSGFRRFTLEAKVRAEVRRVEFWIDGELQRREYRVPYVLSGNKGRRIFYWKKPILNRWFTLITKAGGDRDVMRVMFVK